MLKTFVIDGDKGGVGKSMVARTLADLYINAREAQLGDDSYPLILLDADRANPDICGEDGFTVNRQIAKTLLIDLDEQEGWISLADQLDPFVNRPGEFRAIINMPAGIGNRAFMKPHGMVSEVLKHINAIPIWVLSRVGDGIDALNARIQAMPDRYTTGAVITNLFYGSRDKFTLWDNSDLRYQLLQDDHWVESSLPELFDLLSHSLGRAPFDRVEAFGIGGRQLGFGEKLALNVWRRSAWQNLKVIESLNVQ